MASIVFDLDGTLIDSLPDIQIALNIVLRAEGVAEAGTAETRGFIGHGLPALVRSARAARGLPDTRQEPMTEAVLAHYMAAPATLTRPFPGVAEALDALAAQGYRLGICTNKPLAPTQAILAGLGLARHFEAVIGGDSLPERKPDPAPLHAAFAALGGSGLFVGDSEVDGETARAAGAPFALFTLGYRKVPVEALAPRFAFDDYAALPGLVAGL